MVFDSRDTAVAGVGAVTAWPLLPDVTGDAKFIGSNHRLWLERRWCLESSAPFVLHIGMNPSMAGADRDDLTVRKDQEFTRRMGLSRMIKCNVGTYVSTDPRGLSAPGVVAIHESNTRIIMDFARRAARVVVATGRPQEQLERAALSMFKTLKAEGVRMECFGLTKDHWPKHSSRLAYETPLREFVW